MTVERISKVQATSPISFALGSFDLKYFKPGQRVIKMKQIEGRIRLNKYIPNWLTRVVESGAELSLAPQFGQK